MQTVQKNVRKRERRKRASYASYLATLEAQKERFPNKIQYWYASFRDVPVHNLYGMRYCPYLYFNRYFHPLQGRFLLLFANASIRGLKSFRN